MSHTSTLDVLIVYNSDQVSSASSSNLTPFGSDSSESLNLAYAYFLSTCHKLGLTAGLSSSADISGPGTCSSYWTYDKKAWRQHKYPCRTKQVFDKFSPTDESSINLRHTLLSSSAIKSYGSYSLYKLFHDKQKTYNSLTPYAIPTISLSNSSFTTIRRSITKLKELMATHAHPQDFTNQIILKDRFGAGGLNIFKFDSSNMSDIQKVLIKHPTISFIIQPLIKFDRGFMYKKIPVSTDIRLIYLNGRIVSSYIRMAKSGDFRCNQHQGGSLVYLTTSDLPKEVLAKSKLIAGMLNKQSSLFTLDFLLSNSGHSYLLEGNTGPGLTWDQNDQIDQREAKKLIRLIVSDLKTRVKSPPLYRYKNQAKNPSWPQASRKLYLALAP